MAWDDDRWRDDPACGVIARSTCSARTGLRTSCWRSLHTTGVIYWFSYHRTTPYRVLCVGEAGGGFTQRSEKPEDTTSQNRTTDKLRRFRAERL